MHGHRAWPGDPPEHDITLFDTLLCTPVIGPSSTAMMVVLVTRRQQLARSDLRRQLGILGQHRSLESSLRLVLERWLPVRHTCHHIYCQNEQDDITISEVLSYRYVDWISYGRVDGRVFLE